MVIRGGTASRGSFRGRGGFRGGHHHHHHHHHQSGPGGHGPGRNSVFIPFQAFDAEHCEAHFPRVSTEQEQDDSKLSELLLKRNKLIVPEPDTIAQLDALYNRVAATLGEFKDNNESPFEETRKVGAYSNETLIKG